MGLRSGLTAHYLYSNHHITIDKAGQQLPVKTYCWPPLPNQRNQAKTMRPHTRHAQEFWVWTKNLSGASLVTLLAQELEAGILGGYHRELKLRLCPASSLQPARNHTFPGHAFLMYKMRTHHWGSRSPWFQLPSEKRSKSPKLVFSDQEAFRCVFTGQT